jgi:hypothetical protein
VSVCVCVWGGGQRGVCEILDPYVFNNLTKKV